MAVRRTIRGTRLHPPVVVTNIRESRTTVAPAAAVEVAVNVPRSATRKDEEPVMSHVLRSKKTRTEAIAPCRRELQSTSTDRVPRTTTSQAGVLSRCRPVAILPNILRWEDFRPIQVTWEHPTRGLPDQDIRVRPTQRHLIRTLEDTECNPVILRNVRTIIPVECTTESDLRG